MSGGRNQAFFLRGKPVIDVVTLNKYNLTAPMTWYQKPGRPAAYVLWGEPSVAWGCPGWWML